MAVRAGMLFLAALLAVACLRAVAPDLPQSGQRVVVAAAVALLAPMLWPGLAATPLLTALRVLLWSAVAVFGVVCAALLGPWLYGFAAPGFEPVFLTGALLLALLLWVHTLVALLEAHWRSGARSPEAAREMAAGTVALLLALWAALPLWLGPWAELLSHEHEWVVDAVIGASPLTHLAVASGNDLLRNPWLYQHSNLAALPFSYPVLAGLVWFYAAASAVLALTALAWLHRAGSLSGSLSGSLHIKEKTR